MSDANLKYLTSWRDRHGKRRYFFRANGRKYPLQGEPGTAEFHTQYGSLLAKLEAKQLGRAETVFLKGSIGWVIEQYLGSDQFKERASNTQRGYRRVLDILKARLGPARIADLQPKHIRIVRDEIAKTSTTTADMAKMLLGVLWDHAAEFCKLDLGINPAHDVRRVHNKDRRKPHEPWPAEVIDAFLDKGSEQMRLALHLLLYTGQRVGDVVKMKWSDIANGRIAVMQEKTGERVVIPIHTRLAALLAETPHRSEFVLNMRWGRPYKNADALSGVIKKVLTDDLKDAGHLTTHGLRKNAGIALAEAGCEVPEIQAILGHKTATMALHYVQQANKAKLADRANRKRELAGAA
jgi:integrase